MQGFQTRKGNTEKNQNFQVSESRYLYKAWGKLNLQSSKLAEVRAQGKTPQYGHLIPLQEITKHSNTRAQCYKGLRTENVQMGLRCNFFKEQEKKRGPSLCLVNSHSRNF